MTHTAEEHQTQLAMVAAGLGIAVMPRLGRGSIEGVSTITLEPSLLASDLRHLQDSGVGTTGHCVATVSAMHEVAQQLADT